MGVKLTHGTNRRGHKCLLQESVRSLESRKRHKPVKSSVVKGRLSRLTFESLPQYFRIILWHSGSCNNKQRYIFREPFSECASPPASSHSFFFFNRQSSVYFESWHLRRRPKRLEARTPSVEEKRQSLAVFSFPLVCFPGLFSAGCVAHGVVVEKKKRFIRLNACSLTQFGKI